MSIRILVAALTFLAPTAALAMGLGPPLTVPAEPDAPPVMPVVGSPPVLDITLPTPPQQPEIPIDLPGIPGDLPEPPVGLPDLTEAVDLPTEAERVLAMAPPFGAPFPAVTMGPRAIPEPTTAALIGLGLVGMAATRRRRSAR